MLTVAILFKIILDTSPGYLVLAALAVSALWFYRGYQYLARGKYSVALLWEIIAVLVLLAFCINAILNRAWLGLVIAVTGVMTEIWLIRKYWPEKRA